MTPPASRRTLGASLLTLAALLLLFVPALQPLGGDDLTCGYDNTFHLWRAVQIDRLWEDGVLYSRWAPDMAHGFGFPLYLFASPFPPALVALLHRLGLTWAVAMNTAFALGIVLGGLFIFLLAQELFGRSEGSRWTGRAAGFVAAVAYVYAPFQAYDVFNRGSLWEAFAWAWPPLALWGVHRWSLYCDRRAFVVGVGAFAAMVLSHHLFAFLFAPVFAAWVLLHGVLRRSRAVVLRGAVLGLLGLGISAFFWLPPLLERPYVQTERLLGTWVFDYRHNFISLEHLLALPRRADPRLINDWPEKALGLIPVLVGLVSLIGWRRFGRSTRWRIVTLWALTVGLALLVLPLSLPIWGHAPLLRYVQFPWRYLGPAAFCLALLAGAGGAAVARVVPARRAMGGLGVGALVGVVVLGNLGWFYPRHCASTVETSVSGMIAWERATDTLGSTAKGEYLPIWVREMPEVRLDEAYNDGGRPVRLLPEVLPEGAQIVRAAYGALAAEIELTTPAPFTARYRAFYYPGWHATVDGEPVAVKPEDATGLVTFAVPAGHHIVTVGFGETALRRLSDLVSALSLLAVAGTIVASRSQSSHSESEEGVTPTDIGLRGGQRLGALPVLVVLGVGVVLLALKVLVVDRHGWLWRSSRLNAAGGIPGATVPLNVNFGHQALLLGMDPLPEVFRANRAPTMTLYWRALNPEDRDWHVGVALVGPNGERTPLDVRPARWARTPPPIATWPPEAYARMDNLIDVPAGFPPGLYGVELTLFDRATAMPASVLDADGNPLGPGLIVGQVEVKPPSEAPTLTSLEVEREAPLQTCPPLRLWRAGADRGRGAPGEPVTLRTVWEAVEAPQVPLAMTLTLSAPDGEPVRAWTRPPVAPWWPTDRWQPGDRWAGRSEIRLPGSLESGTYKISLAIESCASIAVGTVEVKAPERAWTVPAGFAPMDVTLEGKVRLAGVRGLPETVAPGSDIDLQLAWEAVTEMEGAYRVYVHLLDENGDLLDQNDGEPVGWTRPTPGWAVDEVVVDHRLLTVPEGAPAGRYIVRVGLYDPDSGLRMTTPDGEDGIVVGTVVVE